MRRSNSVTIAAAVLLGFALFGCGKQKQKNAAIVRTDQSTAVRLFLRASGKRLLPYAACLCGRSGQRPQAEYCSVAGIRENGIHPPFGDGIGGRRTYSLGSELAYIARPHFIWAVNKTRPHRQNGFNGDVIGHHRNRGTPAKRHLRGPFFAGYYAQDPTGSVGTEKIQSELRLHRSRI